nr:hypothetical protein TSUD_264810 [Ipomoea trifida]
MRIVFFLVVALFINLSCHSHVEAAAGSPVKFLPGFDGPLPFHLETGYMGVGKNEEVQLFYYFIKSDSNPEKDPLILWITGGPGCSPLRPLLIEPVEYNGSLPRLLPFPYSWTKVANFIFLDLPVGTGFSYATTSNSAQSDNLLTGSNAYEFLRKWLVDYPEFLLNPFYVGGDSYSGITVPIVTEMISNGNEGGIKPFIQLKGYILGNAATFMGEGNYQIPFAHGMALISDELYELIEGIYLNHILEPICLSDDDSSTANLIMLPGQRRFLHDKHQKLSNPDLLPGLKCRNDWNKLSEYWANDYRAREALHVRKGTKGEWEHCTSNLPFAKIINNTIPYHVRLSKKGYRSLVYSGDHDMLVPYLSTQAWVKSLNYSIVDDWRAWMVEGQVAGYTRTYANRMTFATVKSCHKYAVEAARGLPVKFLPGFDGPLPFQLQTGYIGVGQNEEIQLFYYFIKSDSNPQEDPLILWITGGRTCSALRSIFQQIGPLLVEPVEYNGSLPRLQPFPYSWTKVASIIFLDLPAGTGFSYATKRLENGDLSAASNAYEFLQKWLIDHPKFLSNPFYVGGHSYAGHTVPIITEMISNGIESGVKPLIQLQGYILGSPRGVDTQSNYRVPFAYGMGLITDQLYEDEWKALSEYWANDYNVQMALHVRQGTKEKWELCNNSVPYTSSVSNAIPSHVNLSKKGYRSLIYSGDHEMVSTCLSNEAWIKSLNYSIIDDWRSWMIEGQVAGYTTTYANKMTFVTVKGGGHVVPDYRPFESQVMFERWISYENL